MQCHIAFWHKLLKDLLKNRITAFDWTCASNSFLGLLHIV